jgi:hypothetical protein
MSLSEALRLEREKPNTFNFLFREFNVEGKAAYVPEYSPDRYNLFDPYKIKIEYRDRDVFAELPGETGFGAVSLESNPQFKMQCHGMSLFDGNAASNERPNVTFHDCELAVKEESAQK